MTAVAAPPFVLSINQTLLDAIVPACQKAFGMSNVRARCVGASSVPGRQSGVITGMIGVHGAVSGFITVNLSERLSLQVVEGLLGEQLTQLTPQVIDGVGELTNIVAGGIKSALSRTEWAFTQITVPSVIVGEGCQVAYASGLELLDVTFEAECPTAIQISDRLLHVTLSLLQL
ncbi:MAG: chemotaxis protein CheX [Lacipirellulaceae bacterium]